MLILLDDVKFNNESDFYLYISRFFKDKEILDEHALYDYLTETDEKLEFIINDFDEIKDTGRIFANKIMRILLDARNQNSNIKLTIM
ncbi:hypothetical protein [Ruminococcus sp. Marseille-P6503]|uniref:hypothetical protein n=1 Tax=Ruminococcus sp. Marseille-P6503 TaxID=2364796 RepID=UPI000F54B7B0|nr:hypothetical protein [Ruminococcus sp. Marseille-P6503]